MSGQNVAAAIVAGLAGAAILAQQQGGFSSAMDESSCPSGGGFCDASAGMEQAQGDIASGGEGDGSGSVSEGQEFAATGGESEAGEGGAVQTGGASDNRDTANLDLGGSAPTPLPLGGSEPSKRVSSDRQSNANVAQLQAPSRNSLPNQITVAAPAVRRRIGSQLDALVAREVKSLREDLKTGSMSDDARKALLADHVLETAEATAATELKSALIDLDVDRFERSAKKLDLPANVIEENLPRIRLSRTLQDVQKLVKNGGAADEIDTFARRFEIAREEVGLNEADQSRLVESVEGIVATLRIRREIDAKVDAAAGKPAPAPEGEVAVIYFPPLAPPGKPFLIGERVLAVGSATPGEPVVGQSEASQLLGIPVIDGQPAEEISLERARQPQHDGPMVLSFRDRDLSVKYRLNNVDYTIRPGESQPLPKLQTWTIDFERADGSRVRYTLEDKTYAFTNENGVLDLRAQTFSTTIQHPAITGKFSIVIDNEEVAIPAGQALTISSAYPIVVAFDRGDGAEPAYRRLYEGTYSTTTKETGWELLKVSQSSTSDAETGAAASD